MRGGFLIAAVGLAGATLRAEMPALLQEACLKVVHDTERWAYTETTVVIDAKGRARGETVVRVDPSQPYAKQFMPLKIEGKVPTERQLRQFRDKGERHGQELEKSAAAGPGLPNRPVRIKINGSPVVAQPDQTSVVGEDTHSILYEIPVHWERQEGIPSEMLQLRLRVNKEQRALEHVDIHLGAPFRVRAFVRIKSGEIGMDYVSVDSQFAPALTAMHGDLSLSVFFLPVSGKFEIRRTDLRRVKPYNDHFQVKAGPLQFISF